MPKLRIEITTTRKIEEKDLRTYLRDLQSRRFPWLNPSMVLQKGEDSRWDTESLPNGERIGVFTILKVKKEG